MEEWFETGPCPRSIAYPKTTNCRRNRICDGSVLWTVKKFRDGNVTADPRLIPYCEKLGLERTLELFPAAMTKLKLVVDMENTLVEGVKEETARGVPEGDSVRSLGFRIFKRPGLDSFLSHLAQYYDLWLYATGSHDYISAVINLIDPAGSYFRNRVFRTELTSKLPKAIGNFPDLVNKKDLLLIIDDQPESWISETCIIPSKTFSPTHTVSTRSEIDLSTLSKKFNFAGLREGEVVTDGGDTQLEDLQRVLVKTYERFVGNREAHTAAFEFSEIRKEVLSGEVLCFEAYKQKKDHEPGYTSDRFRLYHFAASALGAIEHPAGRQVTEPLHFTSNTVPGDWLLQCFLHCRKLKLS